MRAPRHLNALRAFEAAARHLSFVGAAQELNVTPAAVGQLVKNLEESYGIVLFNRSRGGPSRLELTPPAITALSQLQAAFDLMTSAVEGLRQGSAPATITVTVPPAFADKWLLGRVEHFQSRYPQFELILQTEGRLVDLAAGRIDLGIRFGHGRWPGLSAEHLMGEEFFPVCSPALLEGEFPLTSPEMLCHHVLIHDLSMRDTPAFPTWQSWLQQAGMDVQTGNRVLRINDSAAGLQAAMAGSGVALGRSSLVTADLQAGRLVRPFGDAQSSPLAYYLVEIAKAQPSAAAHSFKEWLLESAQDPWPLKVG
ncbi:LysR substrate-binding domain-containing protein [Erwinia sp. MMLR14_017]|uniref:LysR substrate-binding domain-containing protein n=1 Tax=Erwinia sp. MMLR14_017 TaxID=3093842 RepID=UPI0029906518|nr:LysR substrate-binding domain-containing protein [Erwinia sp. MMLR14_017]MDW8844374.1 LysR substrate-binding domain-containing protein [Erwinia sp. MMLR14_017]